MATKTQLEKIRKSIEARIGVPIRIVSKKGKRHIVTKNGMITNAYNDIFVVKLFEKNLRESVESYCYSDILTKTVILSDAN